MSESIKTKKANVIAIVAAPIEQALLTGEGAGLVIRDAAIDFENNTTNANDTMFNALNSCDYSTPDAQNYLRHEYLVGRFTAWGWRLMSTHNVSYADIAKQAVSIVDGASFTSSGTTKRTQGKAKRNEAQEKKLATFKTDWSRLLTRAGVKTVSNQGQHRKPRQTDGGTTDKPTKPEKVTIEASPKVVLIADAFAHMQIISKALVTFGALNRDVKGFDDYTKAINEFVIAANRLPKE